jgi:type IV pilus assembly protein PilC
MKYKVYYQNNNLIKTSFVDSLDNSLLPKNIIKIKQIKSSKDYLNFKFYNEKETVYLFEEISLIISTGLSFEDAIDILIKKIDNKTFMNILKDLKYSLHNGITISSTIKKYKTTLGNLPIVFFKLNEKYGDLEKNISVLSNILSKNYNIKQNIISKSVYPIVLISTLILSFIFILNFVVPNLTSIFSQLGNNIPFATKSLLILKEIFTTYSHLTILVLGVFLSIIYVHYTQERKLYDKIILLKIPFFSSFYRSIVFFKFFTTLSHLLNSKYQFQESFEASIYVVKNSYLRLILNQALDEIKSGQSIYNAFDGTNVLDEITLRLISTAQQTNQIPKVLENITLSFDYKIKSNTKKITTIFIPLILFTISLLVLWLIFAIMVPLWDLKTIL